MDGKSIKSNELYNLTLVMAWDNVEEPKVSYHLDKKLELFSEGMIKLTLNLKSFSYDVTS